MSVVARPIRTAPSRGAIAASAVAAVVAVVAAIASFGNGRVPLPPSTLPASPTPTLTPGSPVATSPSPTTSATTAPTDPPPGVARWTAMTPSTPGPDARSGHTWTVDPSSAIAYLFGGRGSAAAMADVWGYDLTADRWLPLRPQGDGPTGRFEHGAAWVDWLGLVVFGGRTDDRVLDDAWAYDPSRNAWRTIEVTGSAPSARAAACLALRADGQVWMYGGELADGSASAELSVYDPRASAWSRHAAGDGPGARAGMACWWTADDRLAVHGGSMPGPPSATLGDLSVLDPDASTAGSWQSAGDFPPRDRAGSTVTSRGGVVFGGIGAGEELLADVVVFDDRTLEATALRGAPDGPAARSGAALADDPEGERVLMYGGRGADGPLRDLWVLDLP
jgi:hypothetical protein